MRKIPFAGIELKSQGVRRLKVTSELPGRPAVQTINSINSIISVYQVAGMYVYGSCAS